MCRPGPSPRAWRAGPGPGSGLNNSFLGSGRAGPGLNSAGPGRAWAYKFQFWLRAGPGLLLLCCGQRVSVLDTSDDQIPQAATATISLLLSINSNKATYCCFVAVNLFLDWIHQTQRDANATTSLLLSIYLVTDRCIVLWSVSFELS